MTDFLVLLVIGLVLGIAITYIVKQKKAGVKCIGCLASGSCSCHCDENILVKKFREDHGK